MGSFWRLREESKCRLLAIKSIREGPPCCGDPDERRVEPVWPPVGHTPTGGCLPPPRPCRPHGSAISAAGAEISFTRASRRPRVRARARARRRQRLGRKNQWPAPLRTPPLVTAQPGWWRERPQTEHAELSPRGRSRRRPEALAHARLRRPRPPAQAKLSSARETGLVDPIPPCSRATATGPPTGRSARASRTARPPRWPRTAVPRNTHVSELVS